MSYAPAPTNDSADGQYHQKSGGQPGPGQMNAPQGGAPPPYGGGPPPGQYQYPPQGQYPPPGQYPPQGAPTQYPPPQPYPNFPPQPMQPGYYPPPQPMQPGPRGYYAPQQPVMIQVTPGMPLMIPGWTETPTRTTCPSCQADVTTKTEYVSGGMTWLICGLLAFTGLMIVIPFFICWIPFCIKSCKDVVHSCPNCKAQIGRMARLNIDRGYYGRNRYGYGHHHCGY